MIDFKAYKKDIEKIFLNNNIDKEEINIFFCEFFNISLADLFLIESITKKQKKQIDRLIKKRLEGCPIQKIFKKAYFFDKTFLVNDNVLCPRPETEILTEMCIEYINKISKENLNTVKVLDLCTGSGCIAITIAKNTKANVYASDISTKALKVAKKNAKSIKTNIHLLKSDMFKNIKDKFDVIISNPPYIPSKEICNLDIEVKSYDPKLALDGGIDGLDFYRIIALNAKNYLNKCGKLFFEVGINEATSVKNLLAENGFDCYIKKDYNDIERFVIGELK